MMNMIKPKWILIILISLIQIQTYISVASAASTDDWTMFRHDLNHSGYTTGSNFTNSAKPLWNFSTGAPVVSSPAIVDGCVFVGSNDGQIYCLNASNGKRIWNFTTLGEVDSSPAIYNGCAYVGSHDGWVYCIDIASGMPIWISRVGGLVRSSPAIVDGCVYVGSGKHDVYCFNASNGVLVWTFSTSLRVDSSPAVSEGVVYVATDDFHVYALNASTGLELWNHHTGSVISSPNIYDGCVYVGSYDGHISSLNASTGEEIWRYQTEDCVDSSPAIAYGHVYFGSEDNNLYCLNASNGVKIWQASTGYWIRSSPVVLDGNVYVGSEDYNVYCFNASTGEKKWSYETGNIVDSSPAIVNGTLYVGSSDGCIYAFTLTNSASENVPSQSTDSLAWTTVAFDAVACAMAAIILLIVLRFGYSTWQAKRKAQTIQNGTLKKPWFSAHTDALFILAILAFSTIFFINLGSGPLWAADEQTYSQWAYHMFKSGDYVTPYAFGGLAVWIGKPPLFMWLVSLAYQVFGVSNFATRLWSPIFGSLTLFLVFFLGKKLYNNYVGLVSALVLGTFNAFYLFARHAMIDITLVFFIVASIYFFVVSEKTEKVNRYVALGGLFFGLALLTKQVEALLVLLIIFSYLFVTKRSIGFIFTRRFTVFWGVGLLVLVPWLGYMFVIFGSHFWHWFIVYCGFMRTVSPLEGHVGGYLFYFNYLAGNERFWAILLPFATGLCIFKTVFKRSKADTLLLAWMTIVLLVFTVAQTKLSWYILPALPAFAIAISSLIYQLSKKILILTGCIRLDIERPKEVGDEPAGTRLKH
jgi:outer membrane protein assembly factor BamB